MGSLRGAVEKCTWLPSTSRTGIHVEFDNRLQHIKKKLQVVNPVAFLLVKKLVLLSLRLGYSLLRNRNNGTINLNVLKAQPINIS